MDILNIKLIEAIKHCFQKRNLNTKAKKYYFSIPTKSISISTGYGGTGKYYSIFDEQPIRDNTPWGKTLVDPGRVVEVFREIFLDNSLKNANVANILNMINEILMFAYDILVNYFIEDLMHTTHLKEILKFQAKTSKLLRLVSQTGGIDTTRQISSQVIYFLERLGLKKTDIEILYNGKKLRTDQVNDIWVYPTDIFVLKKELNVKNGVLVNIKEKVEEYFRVNNINYILDGDGRTYKNLGVSTRSALENYLNQISASIQLPFNLRLNIDALSIPSPNASLKLSSYFDIKGSSTFTIVTLDELFKELENKLLVKILIEKDQTGENIYEDLRMISCSYNETAIEIKVFNLIEYFENMAWEIHRFFADTMDLRAITQKKKHNEKWDGSRGYLNIDKTISASISHGYIYPIQTYRKKLVESPPLLYLVYDISGSMRNVHRRTQFLVIIILSFFEKDIYKFFTGYITTTTRGSSYHHLFRSELENVKEDNRKKHLYDVRKNAPFHIVQQESQQSLKTTLGEVSNDYFDYDKAIRDFLDNSSLGGGTRFDIYNLIPRHPDIDARGLKYVFCVTDAEFTSDADMKDFVRVSRELVGREDVRFFFLWIMWRNEVADASQYNVTQDTSRHFVTRQQIARKIDNLVRTPTGKPKAENQINFAELEFYLFVYDNWDKCHLVIAQNLQFIGEAKNILHKLSAQEFFVQ